MIYLTTNLSSGLVFNKPMSFIKAEAYVYVYPLKFFSFFSFGGDGCSATHMVSPKLLKMSLRVLFTEGITDVKNLGRL